MSYVDEVIWSSWALPRNVENSATTFIGKIMAYIPHLTSFLGIWRVSDMPAFIKKHPKKILRKCYICICWKIGHLVLRIAEIVSYVKCWSYI